MKMIKIRKKPGFDPKTISLLDMDAASAPRTLNTRVIGFIISHSHLKATGIFKIFKLIFYGIITEIFLKYRKFSMQKTLNFT